MKRTLWAVVTLGTAVAGFSAPTTSRLTDVENDWLLAAQIDSGYSSSISTDSDAQGGCDGVKTGKWGFHTAHDKSPWWQVDLGASQPVAKIVLWNRCDGAQSRAKTLLLQFSADGKTWRTVHTNNLTFAGVPDNNPLSLTFANEAARFVRVQLPNPDYLHLDEVEVFGPDSNTKNLALHRPANQSSTSEWSVSHQMAAREPNWGELTGRIRARIAQITSERGFPSSSSAAAAGTASENSYLKARAELRSLLLSDSQLNFNDLLFVKRAPGTFSHMSDQYYGWWSRPGGGVFVLKNWKSEQRKLVNLTPGFAPGSFLKPELSYDGKRVLFSYCRFHPGVREEKDKTHKGNVPEDAFYHVFEMNVDGSGIRQLTRGRYDDFNARFLPNGEIVFLSTRRGTFLQTGNCATKTANEDLPDSYVRCGGDDWRPVAVYTLHVMDRNGGSLRGISPFENFEWDPVVANDGRIMYARWDYVDRDNMPYMSLWSTNPDGTNPQLVYKNHTKKPYGVFEARPLPNSRKLVFTASAHHSISGGSLCLLDTEYGNEEAAPLTRLTPEVVFPEVEGWSSTWYATPFPLSEKLFLTAWSPGGMRHEGQAANDTNSLGLYLYHASGARELIYRDPEITSCDPIPVRSRPVPPVVSSSVAWNAPEQGKFLLVDVYQGLTGVPRGSVKSLRVVGVPAKVQPRMNRPQLGLAVDDPGKFVLGTVPVEADGSAQFHVPSGVNIFFQALDEQGFVIQTMRTVSYVQPGQTLSCVGCHEHRSTAPINHQALASKRAPSRLTPEPDGTWPFRFDRLVTPVLQAGCVRCHSPGGEKVAGSSARAAKFNLASTNAYTMLVNYGKPSLREDIRRRYFEGRSLANDGTAKHSSLLSYLQSDAVHRPLLAPPDFRRLVTWLDVYGQILGSFSDEQERDLAALRERLAPIIEPRR